MPVKIQNCTKRLVSVRLNGGETVHIAPRTFSPGFPEVEVNGNPKVQKLLDRCVIALHHVEKPGQSSAVSTAEKAESTPEKK